MSATPIPKLKKLKMEYVVTEPQNSQELREHLQNHAEQGYELEQMLPRGSGFIVVFGRQDIFS
jgi:hypothetical protein